MNDYEKYEVYIDGEYALTIYGKNLQVVPSDAMEKRIEVRE